MNSSQLFAKFLIVAVVASGVTVACAPKKGSKTLVTKPDGSPARLAPSAETIEQVLSKALKNTYKIGDEANKKVAARLSGATLKMSEVALDTKGEIASTRVEIKVVMNSPIEVVNAKGEIRSVSELGDLDLKDNCGRKIESYKVEARCLGKTCDSVLTMVMVKGGGEAALLFRRADAKQAHALVWAASDRGEVKTTGRTDSAELALKHIEEAKLHGEHFAINEENMTCAPVTQVGAGTGAASHESGAVTRNQEAAAATHDAEAAAQAQRAAQETADQAQRAREAGGSSQSQDQQQTQTQQGTAAPTAPAAQQYDALTQEDRDSVDPSVEENAAAEID